MKALATGIPSPTIRRYDPQEGGKGFVCSLVMEGTTFIGVTTDTTGDYDYDPVADYYNQTRTPSTIPLAQVYNHGNAGGPGTWARVKCYGIAREYSVADGYFWRRDGGPGNSWVAICTTAVMLGNATGVKANGGQQRLYSDKMVVDDLDPDSVYVGAADTPLRVTRDGGTTWADAPGALSSTGGASIDVRWSLIAIDRNSTPTATTPPRRSIVAYSTVGRGLYRSTDGLATAATLLDAARGSLSCLLFNPNDNTLWGCDTLLASNNIFQWNAGFTNAVNGKIDFICFKPGSNLVLGVKGAPFRSTNGGFAWSIFNPPNQTAVNIGRSPIIAKTGEDGLRINSVTPSTCCARYRASTDSFLIGGGYDVYEITASDLAGASTTDQANRLKWRMGTIGMSDLGSQGGEWAPGCDPTSLTQDGKGSRVPRDGQPARATIPASGLGYGYGIDWAPEDPKYQMILAGLQTNNGSGLTTDGWKTGGFFPVQPPNYGGGIVCTGVGKGIAGGGANIWPRRTADGGQTWIKIVLPGVTEIADGTNNHIGFADFTARRHVLWGDKSTPGRAFLYIGTGSAPVNMVGLWETLDHGVTWARIDATSIMLAVNTGYHVMGRMPFAWDGTTITRINDHYLTAGATGATFYDDSPANKMRRIINGAAATDLPNISQVHTFDFGAPRIPGGYPCLYVYGHYQNSQYPGLYCSDNPNAACDWNFLSGPLFASNMTAIAASKDDPGELLLGFSAHGNHRVSFAGRGMTG